MFNIFILVIAAISCILFLINYKKLKSFYLEVEGTAFTNAFEILIFFVAIGLYHIFFAYLLNYNKIRTLEQSQFLLLSSSLKFIYIIIGIFWNRFFAHIILIARINYVLVALNIVWLSQNFDIDNHISVSYYVIEFVFTLFIGLKVFTKFEQFSVFSLSIIFFSIFLFLSNPQHQFVFFYQISILGIILLISFLNHLSALNIKLRIFQAYSQLKNNDMFMIGLNSNDKIEFVNNKFLEAFQLTIKEIVNTPWANFISRFPETIYNINGVFYSQYDTENKTKILWKLEEVANRQKFVLGVFVNNFIDPSKEIEIENQRLHNLLANSGDFVFILNHDYIIKQYFEKYNLFNIDKLEVLNKSIWSTIFIENTIITKTWINNFEKNLKLAIKTNTIVIYNDFLTIAETPKWHTIKMAPINENMEVFVVICLHENNIISPENTSVNENAELMVLLQENEQLKNKLHTKSLKLSAFRTIIDGECQKIENMIEKEEFVKVSQLASI